MPVTETVTTSWFSRLKGALIRIVVGLILIFVAVYFLFANEGRSIQVYRSLVEGAGLVITVDSAKPDPANDGKLVHLSGKVMPLGVPADAAFPVAAEGALALNRKTVMYQWVEKRDTKTENKIGGGTETVTTYSYQKDWRSNRVDSSNFRESGHDNPDFLVESARFTVDQAKVGGFVAQGTQLASLGTEQRLPLSAADAVRFSQSIATGRPVKFNQGSLYIGYSASSPAIGDIKIEYERVDLSEASLVGMQQGDRLVAYTASNGRSIFLAESGIRDAASMFDAAQSENTVVTWLVRALGLIGLFIGFASMMSIFGVIGDVIPFVGSIIRMGTGLLALVLTLIIGPLVIAFGWFAYRPVLAASITAGGLILAGLIVYVRRKRVASQQQPHFGRP